MDSKERHELSTNELSEWLANLPELIKQYRNQLIGVVLIAIGLISWPILNKWKQQSDFVAQSEVTNAMDEVEAAKYTAIQQENVASKGVSGFLIAANNLAEEAKKAPNNELAALALIKRGQALRADLHYSKESVSEETILNQIKDAQKSYQDALAKAASPTTKSMAQLGMGLCSEELGQIEQAKDGYKKIVDDAAYNGMPAQILAKQRLENIDDNNRKYTFVETPAAPAAPVLPVNGPQIQAVPGTPNPASVTAPEAPVAPEPAKTDKGTTPSASETPATSK